MQRTTDMFNGRAYYLTVINPTLISYYLGDRYSSLDNLVNDIPNRLHGTMHHFFDPSFKLGLKYKINGRNHIKINALAETKAPLARDAYISPRVHDRAIGTIYQHDQAQSLSDFYAASQKIVSGDITYEFNYPIVRGRVTGFYTQFWNASELNGYYDDEARTFVNQAMYGINRRHMGLEAAIAVK